MGVIMKTKLLFILIFVIASTMLLTACGSYEKIKTGKYENDAKDSWITLSDNNTFSATISYDTSTGDKLAMRYLGTYSQKSESKLELIFSIKNGSEKRSEQWKIDISNNSLHDPNRNITFKYSEENETE
jgi:hypothetical protein